MSTSRLVVIGASLGGVAALRQLCRDLPADFPAPICIVLHVGAHASVLPQLLASVGPLPAVHAADGQPLEAGRIFVAPPDRHLRIEGTTLRTFRGPKEHHTRPAVDPLFRSAALAFGARTVGVVLTGLLNDGTAGMQAIQAQGGTCVVQDPDDAEAPGMPLSVCRHVAVDHRVRLDAIAPLLGRLVAEDIDERPTTMAATDPLQREEAVSLGVGDAMDHLRALGRPSTYSCPDCGGTLWQLSGTAPQRYLCHTGHAFTLDTLRATQSLGTDEALWTALRSLQEKRELTLQAAEAAAAHDPAGTARAAALRAQAQRLDAAVASLRAVVQDVDEVT